ncbi:MAG: hypothetical protein K2N78_01565 [Oscillospiraceae bacterium]|nr:hypothetical protein [Oscillospiraceae bacterium]
MKHTRKAPLWYNPVEKDARRTVRENGLVQMAADKEGRALLESYCRMYRTKL